MDSLPIELLHLIARCDVKSYRSILAIPVFARTLGPGVRAEYMVSFGYSVEIIRCAINWRLNGKLHRVDGPAIERVDGSKEWWLNDKLHRVDGPAVERADGSKEWYLNGETCIGIKWKEFCDLNSQKIIGI